MDSPLNGGVAGAMKNDGLGVAEVEQRDPRQGGKILERRGCPAGSPDCDRTQGEEATSERREARHDCGRGEPACHQLSSFAHCHWTVAHAVEPVGWLLRRD